MFVIPAISMFEASYMAAMKPDQLRAYQRHRMLTRIRDKETNMKTRLERRRHAIWWKWGSRIAGVTLLLIAVPLLIALVNACWLLVLG